MSLRSFLRTYSAELLILAAMLAVGWLGWRLSPLLIPSSDRRLQPQPDCNLHRGACVAETEAGRVELTIEPRPVPIARPFRIEVRTSLPDVRSVEVDFAGETMNMGYNRPRLAATEPGSWTGEGLIPVCVTGPMLWRATVLIDSSGRRLTMPVLFHSDAEVRR